MIKYIIFAVISFMLGFITREIIESLRKRKFSKKLKPLSKQKFKEAMKNLEIK